MSPYVKALLIFAVLLVLSKIIMMKLLHYDIVHLIAAPMMFKKYKELFGPKNLQVMIECFELEGIWELRDTGYYIFGFGDYLAFYPPTNDENAIKVPCSGMISFSVKTYSGKVDFKDYKFMSKDIEKIVIHRESLSDITIRFRNNRFELAFNQYALPRANFFEFLATKIPYEEYAKE